jgi:hypothetical protein
MAEPKAFAIIFAIILILVGLPMLLFGILQYSSNQLLGSSVLAISIFMLVLGAFFLIIILTQK